MNDTLVEAIVRGIAKAKGIEICADASYWHSKFGPLAHVALTAIADAGYEIVPAQHPTFKAPPPIDGELHNAYLMRVVQSFEDWANSCRATNNGKAE